MLQGHIRTTRTNHRKKQNSQLGWHRYLELDSVAQFLSCNVKKHMVHFWSWVTVLGLYQEKGGVDCESSFIVVQSGSYYPEALEWRGVGDFANIAVPPRGGAIDPCLGIGPGIGLPLRVKKALKYPKIQYPV